MAPTNVPPAALRDRTVSILGYGNQGRAQALNLRDRGVSVVVGARPGRGADQARDDGFPVRGLEEATRAGDLVMLLLPDHVLPGLFPELRPHFGGGKRPFGFSHAYALKYGLIEPPAGARYFLVGPKGAGRILRENFQAGHGLPAVYALSDKSDRELEATALAYAEAIGCRSSWLLETTFDLETEGDLFGEQAVLCGGLMALLEASFEELVKNGHDPKTAFLDCCYEAVLILRLWLDVGPRGMSERISPTAFYGGRTRGARVVSAEVKKEIGRIFAEVRDGRFDREWRAEVAAGSPSLAAERERIAQSLLQRTYAELAENLAPSSPLASLLHPRKKEEQR